MTIYQRAKWISSSKARPCPVCSRNINDKCRWNDTTIACYQGDRFAPPPGLVIGDVLNIEGRRWAVTSLSGGFSGAALIFRIHIDRHDFTPAQKKQRACRQAKLVPTLHCLLEECRQAFQLCLGMPELEFLTADEIQDELDHARATFNNLKCLRAEIVNARRAAPELKKFAKTLDIWLKLTGYQLRDVETFRRVHLGIPSPAQIASLRGAR